MQSIPQNARQIFEAEFQTLRCKMIETAAILDRLDRAAAAHPETSLTGDYRLPWIRQGLETLASEEPDRAKRLQLIFSQPYEEGWLDRFTPAR